MICHSLKRLLQTLTSIWSPHPQDKKRVLGFRSLKTNKILLSINKQAYGNTECSGFPNRKGGQCPLTTNPAQTQTKKKVLEVAGETRVFLIFLMLLIPQWSNRNPADHVTAHAVKWACWPEFPAHHRTAMTYVISNQDTYGSEGWDNSELLRDSSKTGLPWLSGCWPSPQPSWIPKMWVCDPLTFPPPTVKLGWASVPHRSHVKGSDPLSCY